MQHDQGLCIRHWDWSETSQTVAVFTRGHGLVRALAKGSKRPKAAYSGGLELLTRGGLGLIARPSAELALLTEWDLLETFPALRSSLVVHHAGLYIADLLMHAIHDHDPHTALYDQTLESLRLLRREQDVPRVLLKFQWAVLAETGYRPELEFDVRTGDTLDESGVLGFSPSLGGFTTTETAANGVQAGTLWRARAQTRAVLRALSTDGLAGLAAGSGVVGGGGGGGGGGGEEGVDGASLDRCNRLLASYLRFVLGAEPPTMPVIFGHRLRR